MLNFDIISLKNSDDLFFSHLPFLPFSTLLNFCLYVFLNTIHPSELLYTPTCCFPHFYNSLSTLVTVNASECCIHHLFILKSSLHKQPFITAHFRSSLHTKTSPGWCWLYALLPVRKSVKFCKFCYQILIFDKK